VDFQGPNAEAGVESVVDPIIPPLSVERWFRIRGQFVFGLPRNFGVPSPEMTRAWEGRNGKALLCVEDASAADYAMFLMSPAVSGGHRDAGGLVMALACG